MSIQVYNLKKLNYSSKLDLRDSVPYGTVFSYARNNSYRVLYQQLTIYLIKFGEFRLKKIMRSC